MEQGAIELLVTDLKAEFPQAEISIETPLCAHGVWHIEVSVNDVDILIQCSQCSENGFGVTKLSDPDPLYTHQSDEWYGTILETRLRVREMFNQPD